MFLLLLLLLFLRLLLVLLLLLLLFLLLILLLSVDKAGDADLVAITMVREASKARDKSKAGESEVEN